MNKKTSGNKSERQRRRRHTLKCRGGEWIRSSLSMMILAGSIATPSIGFSDDKPGKTTDDSKQKQKLDTIVVQGKIEDRMGIMPTEPVNSVFGFDLSVKETPRSVTSITSEMLNNFNVTDINDLNALSPGTYTQSFFGVAGSLDVRGTPAEVYFRGIRRIENPGNYPTPIGASDRIDIVRGPASPIYGPSRIGGYLNFVPKSARSNTGQYMSSNKGELSITKGSYDKNILSGEVGGPGDIFGKKFGYYVYAQSENSGSYYENTHTRQNLYQGSVSMDLSPSSRIEFGGMYQDYKGNQVAGWNRLTQDLINNGTYITGSPSSFDKNGDGLMSSAEIQEYYNTGGTLQPFIFNPKGLTAAQAEAMMDPAMALQNPGTTHLDGSQVLVSPPDTLQDKVSTLYLDYIHDLGGGGTVTNKMYYENLDNLNENAYGFSQFAKTWAFEDQLIFAQKLKLADNLKGNYQLSPSIRYQDYHHGDNFAYEFFDRRDLTGPSTPIDHRTLATLGQEPYSQETTGRYIDYGLAFLANHTLNDSLHLMTGIRYDWLNVESTCLTGVDCGSITGIKQTDSTGGLSWSASLTYDILHTGMSPYVTVARQKTLITGQGGQVPAAVVGSGNSMAGSTLKEFGVKANWFDGRLYAAFDHFDQERLDYNAQDTVTNNTTEAKGWELELRGIVTNNLTVIGAWTNLKVYNLTALQNGTQFSFLGANDMPAGFNPALMYGGAVLGIVPAGDGRKAGIPENIYSLNFLYNFQAGPLAGLTSSLNVSRVDSTYSGFSKAVKLPGYTLVNAGINYSTRSWKLGVFSKNLTNEKYYRANFPDLFGSNVVLPQLPRTYEVKITYMF